MLVYIQSQNTYKSFSLFSELWGRSCFVALTTTYSLIILKTTHAHSIVPPNFSWSRGLINQNNCKHLSRVLIWKMKLTYVWHRRDLRVKLCLVFYRLLSVSNMVNKITEDSDRLNIDKTKISNSGLWEGTPPLQPLTIEGTGTSYYGAFHII